jgi:hypothetical protein
MVSLSLPAHQDENCDMHVFLQFQMTSTTEVDAVIDWLQNAL